MLGCISTLLANNFFYLTKLLASFQLLAFIQQRIQLFLVACTHIPFGCCFFQLPYFLVNLETFKLKLVQSPSFLGLSICVCLCLLLFRQKPFSQFPCTTFLQSRENITASLTEQFTESEQRCQTATLEKVIVQWSCVLRAHAVRHGH